MKGQASYPFSMVEAAFTFILLMSVAYGTQDYTQNYFKEETADLRADRIERAAELMETYPGGRMDLELTGYKFKVEGSKFYIQFGEANASRDLSDLNYSEIDGPSSYETLDEFCLEKSFENELKLRSCA